jgi:anti-sigma regulatory factor (Ser/Thr protein kinase)
MTAGPKPPEAEGSISTQIHGGTDAPGRARRWVLTQLEGYIEPTAAEDVALVVSELVTNSVLHANVGPRRTLTVQLVRLDARVRISVIDPGSRLEPRVLPPDPDRLGGFGLFVVDEVSEAWGVERDGTVGTRVWCDIPLDRSPSSEFRAVEGDAASVSPG